MINYQRKDAISNPQVGSDFEDLALSYFLKDIPTLRKNFKLKIGIYDQKLYKFDLGCSESKVVIEWLAVGWTKQAFEKNRTIGVSEWYFMLKKQNIYTIM